MVRGRDFSVTHKRTHGAGRPHASDPTELPLYLAKDFEGTASRLTGVNYSEPFMSSEDVGVERFMTIRTCP
jgi:hypothetical protein